MQGQKLPLSVFIIALNEGDRIAHTIHSVQPIASEVIVVDSGSTDDTVKVCEAEGAKVFYNKWNGYGPQKRYAEDQCQHEWLLNLDADEIPSPELIEEIQQLFVNGIDKHSGYTMQIYNMLAGETEIPFGTQMNTCLRLYHKNHARFSDSPVHDSVIVSEGSTGALKGPVLHPSFRSLDHAIEKLNRYSTMQASDMLERGQNISSLRMVFEFPANFIKAYFFRGYIFRGLRGFNYAMTYAYFRLARAAKWHEMKHYKETRP